jgi:hypothetical protein
MYIDPRVAHGIVKTALPRLFQSKAHVEELLQSAMEDTLEVRDKKNDHSRRAFKRLIERRMLNFLAKHRIQAELGEVRDAPSLAPLCITTLVLVGSAQEGIEYVRFYLYPEHDTRHMCRPPVYKHALSRVTAHALARLMHRTGTMNITEVTEWAWAAFLTAAYFNKMAKAGGWKQFGAPAASGLFVGSILEDDTWEFASWFVPSASGQRSRWSMFIDELRVPELKYFNADQIIEKLEAWQNQVDDFNLEFRVPFIRQARFGKTFDEN